ncbi:phage tail tube protein [Lactobacillus sp. PSON]|uniref:phage tail tube protein n=1 Tax=Lactobacillus sp. PSON TaxID=3455454 RepID=UPI004043786D
MASLDAFLNGRDTISTKDATVTVEINGKIIKMIECNKLTAKLEKNKEDVQTLGTHWKHKKTTSVEGTGTLGGYMINSNWLKYGIPYTQNGGDLYFTLTLTIHDPTSSVGKQVVQLTDVNLDDIPIADFEADDGVMEYETDFTFEGVNLIQEFKGMN